MSRRHMSDANKGGCKQILTLWIEATELMKLVHHLNHLCRGVSLRCISNNRQVLGLPAQGRPPVPRMNNQYGSNSYRRSSPYRTPFRRNYTGYNSQGPRFSGPVVCYNCQEEGHIATYCPNPWKNQDYIPLRRIYSSEGHYEQ